MATINIISEPEQLRPTHYPIVYQFDETVTAPQLHATEIFIIDAPVTNGQTFTFYIADTTRTNGRVTVIARDNPSNGDIPTSTTTPINDIVQNLVDTLNDNGTFNFGYTANYTVGNVFSITTPNPGARWNTAYDNNLGVSPYSSIAIFGFIPEHFFSDGTDTFNVFLDVYKFNTGSGPGYSQTPSTSNTTKIGRFLRSKNNDNDYYFDISDFTKSLLHYNAVPNLRATTFTLLPGASTAINLKYGFVYTSGSTFNRVVTEDEINNKWIINASIPFNIQNDSFLDYQLYSGRTFLTNQPRAGKIVDQNESNPLAYFHYATGATNFVTSASIEYTFTDGAVLTALTAHYFDTTVGSDGVYYTDIGPSNLPISGIENLFQKEIASYEVWFQRKVLGNYTDIFTERIKFVLDKTCKDNKRNIIWKNEIGGIDSWTFNGKDSESVDIEQTIYSKNVLNNNRRYIANKSTGIINRSTKINCSSGWLDEDHYDWMKNSLIGSPAVWINETGNVMERIILVDVTVQKDSDNLMHNILITYEKAEYENHIGR